MQSHARVVVVGGGCVGVGVLYGLAKRGWSDCVLLERTRLTAGSTWHAAGLIPSYSRSRSVARMINKSIEIYEGLEAEVDQPVGWHKCGQLRLARTLDRMDEYLSYMSVAEAQGATAAILTAAEAFELFPLIEDRKIHGALYHPNDGHIAPADVTMAMAKGARMLGAKVHQGTEVRGFERLANGEWKALTNQGTITCEHVVLATGNYARQTGAMLGLDVPAIPLVVQYWITDPVPEMRTVPDAPLSAPTSRIAAVVVTRPPASTLSVPVPLSPILK
jgi:dimethylglycine dehydrogenase